MEKADDFDWSNTLYNSKRFDEEKLELDLNLSDEDESFSSKDETEINKKEEMYKVENLDKMTSQNSFDNNNFPKHVDTFSQQLKFICCLKILIEEMSTLANGFEVVGGQLRYYMYYWLERETELLKQLIDNRYLLVNFILQITMLITLKNLSFKYNILVERIEYFL